MSHTDTHVSRLTFSNWKKISFPILWLMLDDNDEWTEYRYTEKHYLAAARFFPRFLYTTNSQCDIFIHWKHKTIKNMLNFHFGNGNYWLDNNDEIEWK